MKLTIAWGVRSQVDAVAWSRLQGQRVAIKESQVSSICQTSQKKYDDFYFKGRFVARIIYSNS